MKGYYLHCNLAANGVYYAGVDNKIRQQIEEFKNISIIKEIVMDSKKNKFNKLLKRLPGRSRLHQWEAVYSKIEGRPDYIYIRKDIFDYGFIDFLRSIKKNFPFCKIVLEIPTYPYDKELFKKIVNYPLLLKDRKARNCFKKFVDRIVTYSNDEEIFEVPTIRIQNGIIVKSFPMIRNTLQNDAINLIAVATLQPYHGYERIIRGVADYYDNGGKREVNFLVVGSGVAQVELEELVKSFHLENKVVFFGMKTGDELTDIFNQADIGIGSFGFYKIGLDRASSLKTREYLARGLPVISGCRQDIFEIAPCDYHLEFPNDSSPVDIQKIIQFYDQTFVGKKKEDVFAEIRKYAEENVTMEKAFAPVIEYLKTTLEGD